jgi:sarcosine oxidase subunit gamma
VTDLSPVTRPGSLPAKKTVGAYQLTVAKPRHILSIACSTQGREEFGQWLETEYGLALPNPGRLAAKDGVTILSSAQNQWFLEQQGDIAVDLPVVLERALSGMASVTEQTGGWVRFEINGPSLADLLCRLCPVDPVDMSADEVARTKIHHIGCLVWRDEPGLAVLGPRSTAGSLWHALAEAAMSASLQAR